jgi:hypothetical protein
MSGETPHGHCFRCGSPATLPATVTTKDVDGEIEEISGLMICDRCIQFLWSFPQAFWEELPEQEDPELK